jgi:hypothetical protein
MGSALLTRGARVTIQFGPFINFKGTVIATPPRRVVVRIRIKKRVILVEIDRDMLALAEVSRKRTHAASS